MEYLFVYTLGLWNTSFSMYCASRTVTEMWQLFTFVCMGYWNIVQVRMSHQILAVASISCKSGRNVLSRDEKYIVC